MQSIASNVSLPYDVFISLASLIPTSDLIKLCQTNQELANLCRENTIWRRKLEVDFGLSTAKLAPGSYLPLYQHLLITLPKLFKPIEYHPYKTQYYLIHNKTPEGGTTAGAVQATSVPLPFEVFKENLLGEELTTLIPEVWIVSPSYWANTNEMELIDNLYRFAGYLVVQRPRGSPLSFQRLVLSGRATPINVSELPNVLTKLASEGYREIQDNDETQQIISELTNYGLIQTRVSF